MATRRNGVPDQPPPSSDFTGVPLRGERALIARLAGELRATPGGVPFGDDLAGIGPEAGALLWSTDMLMDGVDFRSAAHAWRDIGRKAMAVNLSDCAACATVPVAALCAVALSDDLSMDDAVELFRGIRDCGEAFGCPLVGGDTNSWPQPTVVAVTVIARPDGARAPVLRGGARPGDGIYLSGRVGGSLLGRHLHPRPRVREALEINRRLQPRAMIDISDGLVIDLWHICEASGCGAEIDAGALDAVIHPDAEAMARQTGRSARDHALYDGEDFELIVVVPEEAPEADIHELGLLPLGRMLAAPVLRLRDGHGQATALEIRGWEHFRGADARG